MTLNDKRVVMLALMANTDHTVVPSLDPLPPGLVPPAIEGDASWPWAWCEIQVSAEYTGVRHVVQLTKQRWASEREFLRSEEYQTATIKALEGLLSSLDGAAAALDLVGPRPENMPRIGRPPGARNKPKAPAGQGA